jgi:hypothetical protein
VTKRKAVTKREVLNGKPYVGNPHVRFDEEKGASATSRHGVLFSTVYGKCCVLAVLGAFAVQDAYAEDWAASATAAKCISVNVCYGEIRTDSLRDIEYSPQWCGVNADGAHVVIEKIEHAGMPNAETHAVASCEPGAEGAQPFALAEDGARCVRLVHRVIGPDGAQIGDVLERDIAFGIVSESETDIIVDCRATSLKEAAVSNSVVLAYDSSWAANAALLTISAVQLTKEGGEISSATEKTIFSAAADCTGNVPLPCPGRGWWRLFCRVYGADGESPILEYTSCDFKFRNGLIIILQ